MSDYERGIVDALRAVNNRWSWVNLLMPYPKNPASRLLDTLHIIADAIEREGVEPVRAWLEAQR